MYLDRVNIREQLFGLVGFYSPTNPDYPNLIPSLLGTRSGKIVNEAHQLLTIENIDQSIKDFSNYNYPAYDNAVDVSGGYTQGSKVSELGVNYEYINATASSNNPPPNATYWRVIDSLSDYLIKQVYAGVDDMMDAWIDDKKVRTKIKSIYENILLFNGAASSKRIIPNTDQFVGLRIRMKKGERSLVTILNKIGHQFDAAFNGLEILLYHSSQQDPLATYTVDHTKPNSSQWTTISEDNILRYISDDYDAGGDFYIGYNQSQLESLGGKALQMDITWQEAPCDCDSKWSSYYQQYSAFIDVIGFQVSESDMPGGNLFDPENLELSYTSNYGLNLNLSTKCDIGYFILQEEELFAEALNMTIGMRLMQALAYNTRGANQVANQVRAEAKKELFHSSGVWGTLHDKHDKSIKALSFDLSGLSESCFPCDDHQDIHMTTVTLR